MTLNTTLNLIGAVVLLVSGIITLIRPQMLSRLISLSIVGNPRGAAELRTNFGGFFTGVALAAIVVNTPTAYHIVGGGWLITAMARALALVIDRPRVDITFALLFLGEVLMAIFMLT